MKPSERPTRPQFSSGPCSKRPGWDLAALGEALTGRSHRAGASVERIREVIDRTRRVLDIPDGHRIGIVPASDTGAIEGAMWCLLGERPVDVLAWESFGQGWVSDVRDQLAIEGTRALTADYGLLPDLAEVDFAHDVVFAWNGTTSGVRVPDGDWIPDDREGLTLCDATSAVFAMRLPWQKLDVATWSWQKVMGGEAAHGMLVLSPRAVERLESYTPPRPLPKIFRLTSKGKLIEGIFRGETINTPSMLCIEDALDALRWTERIGGHDAMIARSEANLACIAEWVEASDWAEFLAQDPATRSCTSICLQITAPWFQALDEGAQRAATKQMVALLADEKAAYDVGGYGKAPPGLRVWGGSTVETDDIRALLPWLDWAHDEVRAAR
jgi:phosphoserine aminotransferase